MQSVRVYHAIPGLHLAAVPLIMKLWRHAYRTSPPLTAATALVISAAIAGCGGSSHSHPSSKSAATRSAFIASLNSLCNQTNAAYQAAPNVTAATAGVKRYMPRFKSLTPPGDLASLYSRYTAVLEQELSELEHGHQAAVTRLAQTKARPLAVQLGAGDCANPH